MTDISTQQRSLSLPAASVRNLSSLAKRLKHLLSSRRGFELDAGYTSEHILKDVGIRRSQEVPPIPSLGRLW